MDRVETVSFGAYVGAGTRHETAAENGVAHFLEHMAFKGTDRRIAVDIAEEIEDVGGHINAYTAREQTAYYVKLLKEDHGARRRHHRRHPDCHSTFEPEELERERGVILQEIGQANDTPDDIIFDHFQAAAYPGAADGPPGAGHRGDHPRHEARGAARLHARALHAGEHGGRRRRQSGARPGGRSGRPAFRRPAEGRAAEEPMPADYNGGEFREARDLDQVHIVLGFPCVGYGEPDYYPTMLLSTLLGGGMSSRLFQEIREKRGLVYSIYSFTAPGHGWRAVRHLCRHRRERGGGADAGDAGGAAQGAAATSPRPS